MSGGREAVVGRCMHLSEVCSQVWPRHPELLWLQRGSNPEGGGRGDEEGSERWGRTRWEWCLPSGSWVSGVHSGLQ